MSPTLPTLLQGAMQKVRRINKSTSNEETTPFTSGLKLEITDKWAVAVGTSYVNIKGVLNDGQKPDWGFPRCLACPHTSAVHLSLLLLIVSWGCVQSVILIPFGHVSHVPGRGLESAQDWLISVLEMLLWGVVVRERICWFHEVS